MAKIMIESQFPEMIEPEAFGKACQRALRFVQGTEQDVDVQIIAQPRKEDGWLEYFIYINDCNGRRIIMIAMIQRTMGGEWEFHS